MNKRLLLPIYLITFLSLGMADAQVRGNLASSFGVSGGYVEDGIGVMGTFNFHPDRFKYFQVSVLAAFAEDSSTDIPYNIFTVQPGLYFRVYTTPRKGFSFFLGGGGLFGQSVGVPGIYLDLVGTSINGHVVQIKCEVLY